MESKNFDSNQNLYYPTTSYNAAGNSGTKPFSPSQGTLTGVQTAPNTSYSTIKPTINYTSDSDVIVYSEPAPCVTATDGNTPSPYYAVNTIPTVSSAGLSSGSAVGPLPSPTTVPVLASVETPDQSAAQQCFGKTIISSSGNSSTVRSFWYIKIHSPIYSFIKCHYDLV